MLDHAKTAANMHLARLSASRQPTLFIRLCIVMGTSIATSGGEQFDRRRVFAGGLAGERVVRDEPTSTADRSVSLYFS